MSLHAKRVDGEDTTSRARFTLFFVCEHVPPGYLGALFLSIKDDKNMSSMQGQSEKWLSTSAGPIRSENLANFGVSYSVLCQKKIILCFHEVYPCCCIGPRPTPVLCKWIHG